MRVFISSLISGMATFRDAAREAVTTLRHQPIMAEDFGSSPKSPQIACLEGVRQADLVVLILGNDYGVVQPSGLSATHEEYREAKERKPVIAFVQSGVERSAQQAEFVNEVQGWESGLFRGSFKNANDLRVAITRDLHDYQLANATGPIDKEELIERADKLLTTTRRITDSGRATLNLALTGSPKQTVLRPIEIESTTLIDDLSQALLFGERQLFDRTLGVRNAIDDRTLSLTQGRSGGYLSLDEEGSMLILQPLRESKSMMSEIIQEHVQEQLLRALAYGNWLLDRIDETQRLSHIALAVSLSNADHMGWRTQRESDDSPNRMNIGLSSGRMSAVRVDRARAALRLDAAHIVEDIVTMLRRQWR